MRRQWMALSAPVAGLLTLLLIAPPVAANPAPKADSPVPKALEVVRKDGKTVWKLNRSGSVQLWDLVGMFAEAHDVKVLHYPPRQTPNSECSFVVSVPGTTLEGEEIGEFVCNLLDEHKLIIAGFTRGQARIIQVNDYASSLIVVTREELETIHRCEFVSCSYIARSVDSGTIVNAVRGMIRLPMNMQSAGGALVITGRAAQVREMIKLVEGMDVPRPGESFVERYEIPEGAEAETVYAVLNSLFPPMPPQQRMASVFSYTLVGGSMLVRGTSAEHQQVRNIIAYCGIK